MADPIRFVFIVGGTQKSFENMAQTYVKETVQKYNKTKGKPGAVIVPPVVVRFVKFSFFTDNIWFYDHQFTVRGSSDAKPDWRVLNDPAKFPKSSPISIVDVYHAVRRAEPASVLDLSIHSHGFIEGPILAGTNDMQPNSDLRDPADRDGRARKDFTPHMGEEPRTNAALEEFRRGFAPGAIFRVLGCSVAERVVVAGTPKRIRSTIFQVLHAAYTVPLKFASAKGATLQKLRDRYPGLADTLTSVGKTLRENTSATTLVKPPTVIPLEREMVVEQQEALKPGLKLNSREFTLPQLRGLHYATDSVFFNNEANFNLNRPYTELIKYAARRIMESYVFHAAQALPAVTCFGALPGTSGEFEGGMLFVPPKIYAHRLEFYKTYLDVQSMEEGAERQRNYGRFDAATVQKVLGHANTG